MVPQIYSYDTDGGSQEKRRHLQSRIGLACCHAAREFDSKTRLNVNQIPVILDEHVELGRLLGRGGFNEVLEVAARRDESSEEEIWAVKRLHGNTVKTQETFYAGAVDLVSEARILNSLRHKHIIQLHGVSCDDASLKSSYDGDSKYSLYLDCLYGTVDERFDEDRRRYAPDQKRQDLINRIETIALPIAEAMRYLHAHNLIYRDLKPTNMGFDANGTVKLFDFGLARRFR
ncbi:protein kinase [Fragilaria crotonensis]|nr:protein kinase [Fragilaria crotonensis]